MTSPRSCEMCTTPRPATVFCDADACYLCAACDAQVHNANILAQRHRRRPVTSADAHQSSSVDSDILVPDTDLSLSPESDHSDTAYADFDDFDGHFGKMPALSSSETESMFESLVPTTGLKIFDADMSWESVVPDDFDNVVPDIHVLTAPPPVKPEPVVVRHPAFDPSIPATPADFLSARPKKVVKPTLKVEAAIAKPFPKLTVYSAPASSPRSVLVKAVSSNALRADADEAEVKTDAERRQIRADALLRFRAKRANRSFRKKIRYGCRKVLAESRPRVKGRFVKKCDMALFALHGADYAQFKDGSEVVITTVSTSLIGAT